MARSSSSACSSPSASGTRRTYREPVPWVRIWDPSEGAAVLESAPVVAFAPTTDLGRARAFFGGVLGLPVRAEDGFACVFDANGTQLRVSLVEQLTPAPFTILGWTVPDARAAAHELVERGVELVRVEGIG